MLQYKIDVISELTKVGINTTTAKKTGIFGQDTMRKFRNGDTKISLEVLNRLCCVLEMQPRDIIKFVETNEDREKITISSASRNTGRKKLIIRKKSQKPNYRYSEYRQRI